MNRPPIVHDCDRCPRTQCRTHVYVIDGLELHFCEHCWTWRPRTLLDTLNIPTTEEPCPAD